VDCHDDDMTSSRFTFEGGFPTPETVRWAYDAADMNRAVQAYRFFYPTVSGAALFKGTQDVGVVPNELFAVLDTRPRHLLFTPSSDSPYGPILLDLRTGPIVVEVPPGPLVATAIDLNQRWVADLGLHGPDAGKGGRHLMLPPGYDGPLPASYHVWRSSTYRVIIGVRSLPIGGDLKSARNRIHALKVHPLAPSNGWRDPRWVDLTDRAHDTTPVQWETSLRYWEVLHEVIDSEPVLDDYRAYYGELAALGIAKGRSFAPDPRMKRILEEAAQVGNAQMRVQAFADRRPDRIVWPDRRWEWAALRAESADFATSSYVDLDARETWFYQATGSSPALFRRTPGAGSLYWLGLRDARGAYLDGAKTYKLNVPLPVPARHFWSVTVYDPETRSEIQTDQSKAALRSLFELKHVSGASVDLYFGPSAVRGHERHWIKTLPRKGWFVYFRLYGPDAPAFDGHWKPGDFSEAK
jgi:hypothetical protein